MDSHLLIHSNNELDYRANKKAKFDNLNNKDDELKSDTGQAKQESAKTTVQIASSIVKKSPGKCSVSSANSSLTFSSQPQLSTVQQPQQQQHSTVQLTASQTQQDNNVQQQEQHSNVGSNPAEQHSAGPSPQQLNSSQNSNLLGTIASATVSSQSIQMSLETTLANIAPMVTTNNNNGSMTQLTTMSPSVGFNTGSAQKQEPLYRCNMCHHFTTTCQGTLHQHIKHQHNTCQECGYTSNSITELSLHVCHTYDGQNTYTNAILNTADSGPPINFGAMNTGYVQQPAYNTAPGTNTNTTTNNLQHQAPQQQQQPPPPKKRPNRAVLDEDFQQGIYRCRKCNYGTSWKCFLDSHMLTHGGVI